MACPADGGWCSAQESISKLSDGFRELSDRALLVDRTLTAADAIYQLAYGNPEGGPINALIVTENRLPTDEPIRIIAIHDIPILSAALKFD